MGSLRAPLGLGLGRKWGWDGEGEAGRERRWGRLSLVPRGSEVFGEHLHSPRADEVVAGSGWMLPALELCSWVRASHPHPLAAAPGAQQHRGEHPTPPCPGGPRGAGDTLPHPRALIFSWGGGHWLPAPWDHYPSPLGRSGELTWAQPFLLVAETCAGGGSPWLSVDLGFQRSTGNGRWISRQTGLSINSLRGRPTTARAAQSQGRALQLFITFFCSRFLPGSAFLFSRVQTGTEPSAIRRAAAIPNLVHPGCSCQSSISMGSILWVLCPAWPGYEV